MEELSSKTLDDGAIPSEDKTPFSAEAPVSTSDGGRSLCEALERNSSLGMKGVEESTPCSFG